MKTPQPQKGDQSAPNKRDSIFNIREQRAINALLCGPVMREHIDRTAGCSNGPQVIKQLREKGISIECERVEAIDRDGKPCRPGRYVLTSKGREVLERLL